MANITALIVGAVALLTPAAMGIVAFLNPLRQKSRAGGFIRVTNFEALPEDGSPQKFPVIADRTDAWNFFPNVPDRRGLSPPRWQGPGRSPASGLPPCGLLDNGRKCGPAPNEKGPYFFCPCHAASFDLAGKRLDADSPSPRDMDSLETEIRNNNEVWVKFQNFITGAAIKWLVASPNLFNTETRRTRRNKIPFICSAGIR